MKKIRACFRYGGNAWCLSLKKRTTFFSIIPTMAQHQASLHKVFTSQTFAGNTDRTRQPAGDDLARIRDACGEAFRRQGYTIRETGVGGADGGIDLILHKDGKVTLVQCKQWKTQRVDVKVVREMLGLQTHHRAAAVKIVAVGDYTADARRFAEGKPIELINGDALLAMVREVQTPMPVKAATAATGIVNIAEPEHAPSLSPVCPKCGADMVKRLNRKTKDYFWGCATYPACRGTRTT